LRSRNCVDVIPRNAYSPRQCFGQGILHAFFSRRFWACWRPLLPL
jgi:hypothetical protein